MKYIIKGTNTPTNPAGIVVSKAGAMRFARSNMPPDLKKAGFVATVQKGFYGDYWIVGYAK